MNLAHLNEENTMVEESFLSYLAGEPKIEKDNF